MIRQRRKPAAANSLAVEGDAADYAHTVPEAPAADGAPDIRDEPGDRECGEETGNELDPGSQTSVVEVRRCPKSFRKLVAFVLMPAVMLALAVTAGLLSYHYRTARVTQSAAQSSVQAAKDGTVELLSYTPDNVKAKLTAARDLLTGDFRNTYTSLTNDVVIPGALQKRISATAEVPAASTTSATATHAVVLVFINQTVVIGHDAPSETASAVEVTLDKSGDRWLISGFEPK